MANDFTGNPWILDTIMLTAYPHAVFIEDLVWDEQTALGDQLVIKRKSGAIVADSKASGANVYERRKPGHVEGFQLTTLTSGKVMVYIK